MGGLSPGLSGTQAQQPPRGNHEDSEAGPNAARPHHGGRTRGRPRHRLRLRLRLDPLVAGRRTRLRQRQHSWHQHDRRVRPSCGRITHSRSRIAVHRRRRRNRSRALLARRTADLAGWPLPDRRRRRQQPDLGAADLPPRFAPARPRWCGLLRWCPAGQRGHPRESGVRRELRYHRQQLHRVPVAPRRPAGSRSPARRSRCPVVLSRATCCSTAMAANSPGPASGRR